MRRALGTAFLIFGFALAVLAAVLARARWFSTPDVRRGDTRSIETHLVTTLEDAARSKRLGAAALVLVANGEVVSERAFGPASADDTLFLVASVSKAVTAWGVLNLVEEGRLGLDEPVSRYLKRWRLPGDERFRDRVTVRHLLSHTGGLDDGLGYGGFGPAETVQMLEESLTLARDSTVGAPRPARVMWEPGTEMSYSGASYALLELLVEEVTGERFADHMGDAVLRPLRMTKSSFGLDAIEKDGRTASLAPDFDADLRVQPRRRYASTAPVGLYATARDLARFAQAFTRANPVLEPATMRAMLEPQPGTSGTWGLGHTLYASDPGGRVVGHSGGTRPAWGAMLRVNPETGNALVLVVSGGRGALNRLPHDWVWWETGTLTAEARQQALYDQARGAAAAIAVGAIVIVLARRRHGVVIASSTEDSHA